jgi:hypothetical protein
LLLLLWQISFDDLFLFLHFFRNSFAFGFQISILFFGLNRFGSKNRFWGCRRNSISFRRFYPLTLRWLG